MGRMYPPPVVKEHVATGEEPGYHQSISLQEYASRVYVPFYKDPLVTFGGVMTILAGLLIIFVVTGASNAVNLTDGLDGLAAGCLILVALCLAFSPLSPTIST